MPDERTHHVEAEVRFLSADEGGRHGRVRSGYRGQFHYDSMDWDAVHSFTTEWVRPGETTIDRIWFMRPYVHAGRVAVGMPFTIREGSKVVAQGRITWILEMPPPDRVEELRELLLEWDPLQVVALSCPDDEYDCLQVPLMRHLDENATASAISVFLQRRMPEHFGVNVRPEKIDTFVDRLLAWNTDFRRRKETWQEQSRYFVS
jgi:hypothetical protein